MRSNKRLYLVVPVCVNMWPLLTHTLQHGHCMQIHLGMNIELFIQKSAGKVTCCLLSKGNFLLDILRFEVFKQPDPVRMKDLKENATNLYENAD